MAEQNDKSDIRGKPPLFPANFVTLVQLKERWNREQERKRREKEEEEEEGERQKKVVEGEEAGSQRVKCEPINRRNQSWRYDRRDRSRGHEKEKSGEWREKSKKEDRAKGEDEEAIEGEEEAAPSQTSVEKEKVPTRREWGPRGAPRHFWPSIQDASGEIEKKIGVLSVSGANRRDHRYSIHTRYSDRRNSELGTDYGRFHRPGERNNRNAGMLWVKKGKVGDGSAGDLLSKGLD